MPTNAISRLELGLPSSLSARASTQGLLGSRRFFTTPISRPAYSSVISPAIHQNRGHGAGQGVAFPASAVVVVGLPVGAPGGAGGVSRNSIASTGWISKLFGACPVC